MNILSIIFDEKIQLAPIIGAIIASIIVMTGWFIVAYLQRRNEILKKQLDYRLEVLSIVMDLRKRFDLYSCGYSDALEGFKPEDLIHKLKLYGHEKEYSAYLNFLKSFFNLQKIAKK
jgi:hypothetical protein